MKKLVLATLILTLVGVIGIVSRQRVEEKTVEAGTSSLQAQAVVDATTTFLVFSEQYWEAVWSNYLVSAVLRPGLQLGSFISRQHARTMHLLRSVQWSSIVNDSHAKTHIGKIKADVNKTYFTWGRDYTRSWHGWHFLLPGTRAKAGHRAVAARSEWRLVHARPYHLSDSNE